jgi:hypothetical protein
MQDVVADAEFLGPIHQWLRPSVVGNEAGAASIAHLLFLGGPTAIVRGVAFRVVNTFDGVSGRRAGTHIGKKVLEIVPALAHGHMRIPAALASISCRSGPTTHVLPDRVFRLVRESMLGDHGTEPVIVLAATTLSSAVSELRCTYTYGLSASAATEPVTEFASLRTCRVEGQDRQAPEDLSGQVVNTPRWATSQATESLVARRFHGKLRAAALTGPPFAPGHVSRLCCTCIAAVTRLGMIRRGLKHRATLGTGPGAMGILPACLMGTACGTVTAVRADPRQKARATQIANGDRAAFMLRGNGDFHKGCPLSDRGVLLRDAGLTRPEGMKKRLLARHAPLNTSSIARDGGRMYGRRY